MLDLRTEKLEEARKIANRVLGNGIAPNTIYRWIRKGSNGVRLEAIKAGRKWLTTQSAFNEFLKARTESALQDDAVPDTENGIPADVSQEELEAVGLL